MIEDSHSRLLSMHMKQAEYALSILKDYQIQKFAERYYKGGWEHMDLQEVLGLIIQEVSELARAIRRPWEKEEILREAADVANFCAIMADLIVHRETKPNAINTKCQKVEL